MPAKKADRSEKQCPQFRKKGCCSTGDRCEYLHLECTSYNNSQLCEDTQCKSYHRVSCKAFSKDGHCYYPQCTLAHIKCPLVLNCKQVLCPQYHPDPSAYVLPPLDNNTSIQISQSCIKCQTQQLLYYSQCGCQNYCQNCFVAYHMCPNCNIQVKNYIQ